MYQDAEIDRRLNICRELKLKGLDEVDQLVHQSKLIGIGKLIRKGLNANRLQQLGYSSTVMEQIGYSREDLEDLGFKSQQKIVGEKETLIPQKKNK